MPVTPLDLDARAAVWTPIAPWRVAIADLTKRVRVAESAWREMCRRARRAEARVAVLERALARAISAAHPPTPQQLAAPSPSQPRAQSARKRGRARARIVVLRSTAARSTTKRVRDAAATASRLRERVVALRTQYPPRAIHPPQPPRITATLARQLRGVAIARLARALLRALLLRRWVRRARRARRNAIKRCARCTAIVHAVAAQSSHVLPYPCAFRVCEILYTLRLVRTTAEDTVIAMQKTTRPVTMDGLFTALWAQALMPALAKFPSTLRVTASTQSPLLHIRRGTIEDLDAQLCGRGGDALLAVIAQFRAFITPAMEAEARKSAVGAHDSAATQQLVCKARELAAKAGGDVDARAKIALKSAIKTAGNADARIVAYTLTFAAWLRVVVHVATVYEPVARMLSHPRLLVTGFVCADTVKIDDDNDAAAPRELFGSLLQLVERHVISLGWSVARAKRELAQSMRRNIRTRKHPPHHRSGTADGVAYTTRELAEYMGERAELARVVLSYYRDIASLTLNVRTACEKSEYLALEHIPTCGARNTFHADMRDARKHVFARVGSARAQRLVHEFVGVQDYVTVRRGTETCALVALTRCWHAVCCKRPLDLLGTDGIATTSLANFFA